MPRPRSSCRSSWRKGTAPRPGARFCRSPGSVQPVARSCPPGRAGPQSQAHHPQSKASSSSSRYGCCRCRARPGLPSEEPIRLDQIHRAASGGWRRAFGRQCRRGHPLARTVALLRGCRVRDAGMSKPGAVHRKGSSPISLACLRSLLLAIDDPRRSAKRKPRAPFWRRGAR